MARQGPEGRLAGRAHQGAADRIVQVGNTLTADKGSILTQIEQGMQRLYLLEP